MTAPARGDVWLVDLNPTRGHDQAGMRPALVLSVDLFNRGPAGLVIVVSLTTKNRKVPLHVAIGPPEGGLRARSYAKCEDVRSISTERLTECWGRVATATMRDVEDRLRVVMGL